MAAMKSKSKATTARPSAGPYGQASTHPHGNLGKFLHPPKKQPAKKDRYA